MSPIPVEIGTETAKPNNRSKERAFPLPETRGRCGFDRPASGSRWRLDSQGKCRLGAVHWNVCTQLGSKLLEALSLSPQFSRLAVRRQVGSTN